MCASLTLCAAVPPLSSPVGDSSARVQALPDGEAVPRASLLHLQPLHREDGPPLVRTPPHRSCTASTALPPTVSALG